MRRLLGEPRVDGRYSDDCDPVTGPFRSRIVTRNVGPFRVTGLEVAVDSLSRVFREFRKSDPEAYETVGTAGMLCVRWVRGSRRTLSNHSWGTAIDLTWDRELQHLGTAGVQRGALAIYRHMRAEGWYWGAGFKRNDPMHWELAEETVRRLLE